MPTFRKSPPDLVARFAELADQVPDANRRQMFGYPTCVLNGNMFMGLHEDKLFLRLADADQSALLEKGGAPFEPMPGRPMRGYIVVPPTMLEDDPALAGWIAKSFDYATSLPPKKPKPPKK